jgi:protein-S-isoprenylcysteine O-methyltransferase Ste14
MTDFIAGFFAPWLIYALILVLHLLIPARRIVGYVRNVQTKELLRYRLNGLPVMIAVVGVWAILGSLNLVSWDWLYYHRWSGLAGACTLGLIFSAAIVFSAPSTGRSILADLFLGRLENPQFLNNRVDAKMFLYLAGATMLALNLASFFSYHLLTFKANASPGVILYCCLFFWFLIDYLVFEHVHLYTYDLVAERVGFKLGWGCLTFYAYIYAVGLWATAGLPDPKTPGLLLVVYGCMFFAGWILARGANMQKYLFKIKPQASFLGILAPKTVTNGRQSLLCSGFWGVSRHVNYLGEILMATGITLALGWPGVLIAWLYPLYYVFLLLPRERADERRCAAKYGPLWDEYVRQVPKRIIPGVY